MYVYGESDECARRLQKVRVGVIMMVIVRNNVCGEVRDGMGVSAMGVRVVLGISVDVGVSLGESEIQNRNGGGDECKIEVRLVVRVMIQDVSVGDKCG